MQADATSMWVEVAIETPLVIFHLSVLCVLSREILRRNAVFSTAFFVLYCVQSVADIVYYLAVSDAHLRIVNHPLVDGVLLEQWTGTLALVRTSQVAFELAVRGGAPW